MMSLTLPLLAGVSYVPKKMDKSLLLRRTGRRPALISKEMVLRTTFSEEMYSLLSSPKVNEIRLIQDRQVRICLEKAQNLMRIITYINQ